MSPRAIMGTYTSPTSCCRTCRPTTAAMHASTSPTPSSRRTPSPSRSLPVSAGPAQGWGPQDAGPKPTHHAYPWLARNPLWLIVPEPLPLPCAASLDAEVSGQTWSSAKPGLALWLESESYTKVQPCLTSADLGSLEPSALIQMLLELEMTLSDHQIEMSMVYSASSFYF